MRKTLLPFLVLALVVSCSNVDPVRSTATAIVPPTSPTARPSMTPTATSTETPLPAATPTILPTARFRSVVPTLAATSASCPTGFPNKICVSALNIALTGRALDHYEVTVEWPGFSGASFECPLEMTLTSFGDDLAPIACNSKGISFASVGLAEIMFTIKWDGGSYTQTLIPDYEIVAPQGPEC